MIFSSGVDRQDFLVQERNTRTHKCFSLYKYGKQWVKAHTHWLYHELLGKTETTYINILKLIRVTGRKKSWPDRDSNPGTLAHRASTLPTEPLGWPWHKHVGVETLLPIYRLATSYTVNLRYNSKIRYNVSLVCQGDSNKYTKRKSHKKLFKSIRYSYFREVHIKFLYNSKFDFIANS